CDWTAPLMMISGPVPHPTPASVSEQWSWRRKACTTMPCVRLCDNTFSSGRIGFRTKADAVTYFGDLGLRLLE
ncbi:MAG: hypothetical protein M3M98_01500, partial [Nitrospirota bacterium]|nr:hypothetical protein [Nitrospirota bacterium]